MAASLSIGEDGSVGRRSHGDAGRARGAQEVTGPALHVVLVEPEIHWNTGNAGRTCLAVGIYAYDMLRQRRASDYGREDAVSPAR